MLIARISTACGGLGHLLQILRGKQQNQGVPGLGRCKCTPRGAKSDSQIMLATSTLEDVPSQDRTIRKVPNGGISNSMPSKNSATSFDEGNGCDLRMAC